MQREMCSYCGKRVGTRNDHTKGCTRPDMKQVYHIAHMLRRAKALIKTSDRVYEESRAVRKEVFINP
jgi:hypothetical protein